MSTVTTLLGLTKPAGPEQFNLATYNNNLDLVDGGMPFKKGQKPFAHMGRTAGFQGGFTTSVQTAVQFSAAQKLHGGFTFDAANNALVVPTTGSYRVTVSGMYTGTAGNLNIAVAWKNNPSTTNVGGVASGPKPDGNDVRNTATAIVDLVAGDKIGLVQQTAAQAWGTTGYDGSYVEVEWVDV